MGKELLASKIVVFEEPPRVRPAQGAATSILGMVGLAERGPVGERRRVTSFEEWRAIFGRDYAGSFAALAVRGFFENGGRVLDFVRTVHYADPSDPVTATSAKASATIQTAGGAPTKGRVEGTAFEPFNLEPGDTLLVTTDAGGPTTVTFSAAAASLTSGNVEPFALADGQTLDVVIDGGPTQTVTFLASEFTNIAAATAAEVAAVLNAKLVGASATAAGGAVTITSDTRGTGSSVQVTGGTANAALGFSTVAVAGTGNVANIDAVTAAEVKALVEAAVTGVVVDATGGNVAIERTVAGATAFVQVDAASTADGPLGLDNAQHYGTDGTPQNTLQAFGKWDGAYANKLSIEVLAASNGKAEEFNLRVLDDGAIVESFPNVTMDSAADNYVVRVVNDADTGSALIELVDLLAAGTTLQRRPADGTHGPLSGGDDGLAGISDADFIGDKAGKTGLHALDDATDLDLVCVPESAFPGVHLGLVAYAEERGDVLAILDPPEDYSATLIVNHVRLSGLSGVSERAAIYWPRVNVVNPNVAVYGDAKTLQVPPSGHIAGVMARTAAARPGGIYDQPAGVERGILRGVVGVAHPDALLEEKRDLVYPERINPITTGPGQPIFVDGSRVMKGDGNFPSVGERRGVLFIEKTLKDALQFARHSNNTPELRAVVERTIVAFLLAQFRVGAFRGKTPAESFFVDVGEGINPPSEQFAGRLNVRIGLATAKPAEFIILRISQDTRALEEELARARG